MKTVVVVPTYNEAEGILTLLDAVLREAPDVDVLVVDDSSPDGTAALVAAHPAFQHRVHLLSRAQKDGLGAAYRAGFGWALSGSYEAVVQMDADLSHPPERLPAPPRRTRATRTSRSGPATSTAEACATGRGAVGRSPGRQRLRAPLPRDPGPGRDRGVQGLPPRGTRADRGGPLGVQRLLLPDREHVACQPARPADHRGADHVPDRTRGESKMSADIVREAMLRVLTWRWREITHEVDHVVRREHHDVAA